MVVEVLAPQLLLPLATLHRQQQRVSAGTRQPGRRTMTEVTPAKNVSASATATAAAVTGSDQNANGILFK